MFIKKIKTKNCYSINICALDWLFVKKKSISYFSFGSLNAIFTTRYNLLWSPRFQFDATCQYGAYRNYD